MWPALLPFPLHSKWKIRRSISKVGTQKDSWTSTEPCPYASPPLSLRRPVALQLHTAWYDSEEKGVFPDPFNLLVCIYACVYIEPASQTHSQLQRLSTSFWLAEPGPANYCLKVGKWWNSHVISSLFFGEEKGKGSVVHILRSLLPDTWEITLNIFLKIMCVSVYMHHMY